MSVQDRYVFMPSFSIQPNKICLTNQVFIRDRVNVQLKSIHEFKSKRNTITTKLTDTNTVTRQHHNFQISDNAFRTIKSKINWLYYLSKPKSVKTYSGKDIFNFKCAFITLTLPSKQKECTQDITSKYFNQFLTEIRQRTKMANYVWRLEFQKNGNVHYHLITDTYLDYFFVRNIWNRIISKGGYIAEYQKKFINLNLSQYNKLVNSDGKQDFKVIAMRYEKGKKENWSQPNSVDIKSVNNNQSIANYLSKYFAKDSKHDTIKNELDNDDNSKSLRLWFCSRSLSKLKAVKNFIEAVDYNPATLVDGLDKVRKLVYRYATVYYFIIKDLPIQCKKMLSIILKSYSKSLDYFPSD
ncbi:MAG: hypothetical protein WBH21_01150 [Vibrio anguillarum]